MRKTGIVCMMCVLLAMLLVSCPANEPLEKTGSGATAPATIAKTSDAAPPSDSTLTGKLNIIHAGSLSVPFKELSDLFMAQHPGVEILTEAHGSRDCARQISELDKPFDVMASADYSVIDNLLIPDHATWNIRFATNEMAIAYTEKSVYGDEFSVENWHEILLREDVAFGRADPNSDPCGYRSVLTMQLAETHSGIPGLATKLEEKDGEKYIRPKETDLLALLEAGEIDYLFIYRSVSEQHGLKFLILPDEVNLKSAELAELYSTASVEITGKEPGTFITKQGAPMVYGVTIPLNSENPEMSLAFVELLLSKDGQGVMERNGQPAIVPGVCEQYELLPEQLKPLCLPLSGAM